MKSRFCVVVPVLNEREHLPAMLASLAAQDFPRDHWRVLIVDGGSTDGSAELAHRWLAEERVAGAVLTNPRRSIPTSLNLAVRAAADDESIIRLDAHSVYGARYVSAIAEAFATLPERVACVGGIQTPGPPESFDRALSVALMTNRMGLGGAAFRRAAAAKRVEGVYLGAWRAGVLQRLGGFDERWEANEDAELAARLARSGGETWLVPLESRYAVKRDALGTARQWQRYGIWRGRTARRHPQTLRPRHVVPLAATAIGLALVVARKPRTLAALAAVYGAGILAAHPRALPPLVGLASCVYFPVCHVGFALGFAYGLATPLPKAQ